MAKNVILGSGLIAMLVKRLLGDEWEVVPCYQSRFFSFNPPLDDNFIVYDKRLDDVMRVLVGTQPSVFPYKRAWSINGQISSAYDAGLAMAWLHKLFDPPPSHAELYMRSHLSFMVYQVRLHQLYGNLLEQYRPQLVHTDRMPTSIAANCISFNDGSRLEFDKVISTVPLNYLLDLMGYRHALQAKPMHYWHVQTSTLDFEGNNQLLVVDPTISFFRVTNIAPERYLFYCHEHVEYPGPYLSAFMSKFEILDGTSIRDAIPCGERPDLSFLEPLGIFPIGAYAQWDWCLDVGSCLLRLLGYLQRNFSHVLSNLGFAADSPLNFNV
jgi:hypothetical protein